MAKLIIGLAGEMGSGKGTAAKYIVEKYKGNTRRFSTVLRDVLNSLHIEITRDSISLLSKILRENFGEDVFAKGMHLDVESDSREVVVIDGIRRIEDIKNLRDLPHFKFVYMEANLDKRYERIVARGENVGDNVKTFEEFKREHELNTEMTIVGLKKYADYVIENNKNLDDLHGKIDEVIKQNLG